MSRKYRINPTCPYCREEHCYWTVELTEKEQEKIDGYYLQKDKQRLGQSKLLNMIEDIKEKPLIINRNLRCGACGEYFNAYALVLKEHEVGYKDPDLIPMGVVPLSE